MKIAVIGGGPAGLMAAEAACAAGSVRVQPGQPAQSLHIDLYDAMASVGRKLLLAGKGGLNLTHAEPPASFLARYGARREQIAPWLAAFGPNALREWVRGLGIETFVGTSGRVFPSDLKAAPLLRAWLRRLRQAGVTFHVRHRWCGWDEQGALRFLTPQGPRTVQADAVVLALGGGSWPKLGSDGAWVPLLAGRGVPIAPFRPANCGFDVGVGSRVGWSDHFRAKFAGHPLKSLAVTVTNAEGIALRQQGECMVTETGLEGGVIYLVSACLRDAILAKGAALLHLDLAPDRDLPRLVRELSRPRGSRTVAKHLHGRAGIAGVKAGLLRETLPKQDFADPARLAAAIKALPLRLVAARPLAEAISTAGGVDFAALDDRLMLRSLPGVFCAGEMLDWEAPTGGYLLTACFAAGQVAGAGAVAWLTAGR